MFLYKKEKLLKRTPLKAKNSSLKRVPFNSKSSSSLKKTPLKKTTTLRKQSVDSKEKWEKAREKCIERDKGKCQVCNAKGTQVHHIHLRSARKDLLYNMNNLILLCDKHHFHKGSYNYDLQTEIIARAKNMSKEDLLAFAETRED